jgi:hypothetical protein
MIGVRLRVHPTCRADPGAWMAGLTHAVVRCKPNQIIVQIKSNHLQLVYQ